MVTGILIEVELVLMVDASNINQWRHILTVSWVVLNVVTELHCSFKLSDMNTYIKRAVIVI